MLAASKVLRLCKVSLELLQEETDEVRWNVHWFGAVSLLRAVGHVLVKVDGPKSAKLRNRLDDAYSDWKSTNPNHAIFRDFIDSERNNLLKEFRSSVHPNHVTRLVIEDVKFRYWANTDGSASDIHLLDENLFRPVLGGYGQGEDARDIYEAAIGWWQAQLNLLTKP